MATTSGVLVTDFGGPDAVVVSVWIGVVSVSIQGTVAVFVSVVKVVVPSLAHLIVVIFAIVVIVPRASWVVALGSALGWLKFS